MGKFIDISSYHGLPLGNVYINIDAISYIKKHSETELFLDINGKNESYKFADIKKRDEFLGGITC